MQHLDQWQALGVVCGSLVALLTLLGLTYRWMVLPVWRTIRRLNEVADDILGDKAKQIPSLTERIKTQAVATAALQEKLDEHLRWHQPARANGAQTPTRQPKKTP